MAFDKHFIIDCDVGTDDALAVMMAFAQPQIEVVAMTTVYGNSTLADTSRNTFRLLKFCGKTNIPVYKGSAVSLLGRACRGDGFHGDDAFGDVVLEGVDPVDESVFEKEHAAVALTRLAAANPGKMTLVAIGPLTNIALALHLDSNFGRNLRGCCIMGGNIYGKGNQNATAEFNIMNDPEAAKFVFDHLSMKIVLASLDICLKYSWSWELYQKFLDTSTKKAKFAQLINNKIVANSKKKNSDVYFLWDQLAMAVAIDESVVTSAQDVYVTVELSGQLTRGQMVVDWNHHYKKQPNVSLIMEVDKDKYDKLVFKLVE